MVTRQRVTRKVCKAVVKMHTKYSRVNNLEWKKPFLCRKVFLQSKVYSSDVVITGFDISLDGRSKT